MEEQRYCFIKDDDSHNYLIPVEYAKHFTELLENGEDDCYAAFNNEFDQYRVDAMTNWSFTNPKEDA